MGSRPAGSPQGPLVLALREQVRGMLVISEYPSPARKQSSYAERIEKAVALKAESKGVKII